MYYCMKQASTLMVNNGTKPPSKCKRRTSLVEIIYLWWLAVQLTKHVSELASSQAPRLVNNVLLNLVCHKHRLSARRTDATFCHLHVPAIPRQAQLIQISVIDLFRTSLLRLSRHLIAVIQLTNQMWIALLHSWAMPIMKFAFDRLIAS